MHVKMKDKRVSSFSVIYVSIWYFSVSEWQHCRFLIACYFTEAWKSVTDKVQEARSNAQLKELSFEGEMFDHTQRQTDRNVTNLMCV